MTKRAKRQALNHDLIVHQLEVLQHSRKPETAAKKFGTNYATYLARFRRAGISVKEASKRLRKGEQPEAIAAKLFIKSKDSPLVPLGAQERLVKDITELVQSIVHRELKAA